MTKHKGNSARLVGGVALGLQVPDVYQCFTKEMGVFSNPTSQNAPAKLRVAFEVRPLSRPLLQCAPPGCRSPYAHLLRSSPVSSTRLFDCQSSSPTHAISSFSHRRRLRLVYILFSQWLLISDFTSHSPSIPESSYSGSAHWSLLWSATRRITGG